MSSKAAKTAIVILVAIILTFMAIVPAASSAMEIAADSSAPVAEAADIITPPMAQATSADAKPMSRKAMYMITVAGVMGFAVTGALVVSGVRKVEDAYSARK